MKGIILAGGSGTRLYPSTICISKQLLPIYDKPMIYYPLSVLMLAGIREIAIISTPKDIGRFEELLGNGSKVGMRFKYIVQNEPKGIAEAFILADSFLDGEDVCLILGDNIFYGHGLPELLTSARQKVQEERKSVIFSYRVGDPERYGVVELDSNGKVLSLEEKPKNPRSNYAVVGIYLYPNDVTRIAKTIVPSSRGELEITDINILYMSSKRLCAEVLGRGYAWLDTGTHESFIEASNFIQTIEQRQGLKIACIEEIAYFMGYIDIIQLKKMGLELAKSSYGQYLLNICNEQEKGV